jgi:MFS family permease
MLDGIAGMGLSVVRGLMSKMVESESQGALWSAVSAMSCVAQIVSPIIFNGIYAKSVSYMPNLVFFLISGLVGIVCFLSFFVKNEECSEDLEDGSVVTISSNDTATSSSSSSQV